MKEINYLLEKSEKFLITAKHTLDIGDYDSCVSRCYYSMFFMVEAILLTKGLSAKSHKGVISFFGEHFIKTEIFKKSLGKDINYAHDKRLSGDYGIGFTITKDEAEELFKTAVNFVGKIKNYIEKWKEKGK